MSLTRRLRRLVRAHLGDLGEDPLDNPADPSVEVDLGADASEAASSATSPDVPPDVAKAYRALEVPVGSDRETVKTAYREMMKKYHQDRFANDDEKREVAGTVSKRINQAYDRITEYLDDSSR